MKRSSEVIAFRADAALLRLVDVARQPFELSRGDWSRGIITAEVHRPQQVSELQSQLSDLRQMVTEFDPAITKIHTNLARTLFVLLTTGGLDADQAREIVRTKLLS